MRHFWYLPIAMLVAIPGVWAHEELIPEAGERSTGVLSSPSQTVDVARGVIERLDPTYETVIDINNGDQSQGISAALYQFTSNNIHVGDWRLGVGTGTSLYSTIGLDIGGVTKRLAPDSLERVANNAPLTAIWAFIGKYGRLGVGGGYSWDHEDPMVVLTAGAGYEW